jgi:hypothetical protein
VVVLLAISAAALALLLAVAGCCFPFALQIGYMNNESERTQLCE